MFNRKVEFLQSEPASVKTYQFVTKRAVLDNASLLAKYQKSHDKIEPYVENLDSHSIPQEFIDEAKLTVPYFDGTKITNASKAYYDWKMKLTVEDFIALAQEMSDQADENNDD